ncbi:MAG: ASCH domain-containing protein [Methyloprofundus sp.]|nr:ASCH domain-containing protein [Methyloprofundus sp.]
MSAIPSKGLIIKSPYIDRILAGTKTWEMRSSSTKIRGPIALIKQGTGEIIGVANLVDVKGPLDAQDKREAIDKHQISIDRLESGETDKWHTAWVLGNAQPLIMPVRYQHPNGAVIWVNLELQVQDKLALVMQ